MSTSNAINPSQANLMSSKKKRSKAEAATAVSEAASISSPATPAPSEPTANGGGTDFPVLKELQKNLRNANKKLNATAKVDSIIAENPGKTLDELVAEHKMNLDQKAQALKKPSLQANIAQFEEQISQFKQHGAYYEERLAHQKTALEEAHKKELEAARKELEAARKDAADEATRVADKAFRDRFLVMTRFLRAAAAVRVSGDDTSSDSRAFEGVLLQVYGGTDEAVSAMVKLVDGSSEQVPSVDGELLEATYERVKQASVAYNPGGAPEAAETQETEAEAQAVEVSPAVESLVSDPTIAHAGMTELGDPSVAEAVATSDIPASTHTQLEEHPPSQTIVNDNAANPIAQADWEDPQGHVDAQTLQSGVEPAAVNGASAPVDGSEPAAHHVRQNSGRGRGFRGRGRADGFRGRGGHFRGDFRGRGRGRGGEFRGGRRGGHFAQGSGPSTPPAQ